MLNPVGRTGALASHAVRTPRRPEREHGTHKRVSRNLIAEEWIRSRRISGTSPAATMGTTDADGGCLDTPSGGRPEKKKLNSG
jgi:hypothetical protein